MDTVDVTLISAALAGIVSFASPCVLPLAIPYLAWIGAISVGAPHGARPRPPSRRTALVLTGAFVAGFVSMFVALGMAAALAGAWLEQWQRPAAILAGAVLIVLGLHVGRIVRVPIFDADARLHTSTHPAGPVGAYLVGVAFAFGWSPCIGPILAAVLTLAGTQKSVTRGPLLLGVYGLGMGAPFLFGADAFVHAARGPGSALHAGGRVRGGGAHRDDGRADHGGSILADRAVADRDVPSVLALRVSGPGRPPARVNV
jgi:cytochrome c-type biogenesis protein